MFETRRKLLAHKLTLWCMFAVQSFIPLPLPPLSSPLPLPSSPSPLSSPLPPLSPAPILPFPFPLSSSPLPSPPLPSPLSSPPPPLPLASVLRAGPIPCKYHHSSTGCYRGNQCRFSHDSLNEVTSEILQQVRLYVCPPVCHNQPILVYLLILCEDG